MLRIVIVHSEPAPQSESGPIFSEVRRGPTMRVLATHCNNKQST
jgi:hypothetical protein